MAKKNHMTWMVRPARAKKSAISESLKAQVDANAQELVESVLKPRFIQPPKKPRFNYIIDVAATGTEVPCTLSPPTPAPAPRPSHRPLRPSSPAWNSSAAVSSICRSCGTPANGLCCSPAFPWTNAWMPSGMIRGFRRD